MWPAVLSLVVVALGATEPMGEVALTRLDGSQAQGALVSWSGGKVVVSVGSEQQTIPQAEVLAVRFAPADPPVAPPTHGQVNDVLVELIDGSRVAASSVRTTGGRAEFSLDDHLAPRNGPQRLPMDRVAAIQLQPLTGAAASDWIELRRQELPADLLVIQKGQQARLDYLEGTIGDINATHVQFALDGESIAVKRDKVVGIVYYRANATAEPGAVGQVYGPGDLKLAAATIGFDGRRWRVDTVAGLRLELPPAAIESIDFSAGKLVYLSDLRPLTNRWTPLIGLPDDATIAQRAGEPRFNESFFGSQLSLAVRDGPARRRTRIQTFARGLAVRSRTELIFQLPEGYRRFMATAGIDPEVREQGHVRLLVEADGQPLLDVTIAGTDEPRELDVPLGEARRLRLVVDYGDNWDRGDLLNLCDARLTK